MLVFLTKKTKNKYLYEKEKQKHRTNLYFVKAVCVILIY